MPATPPQVIRKSASTTVSDVPIPSAARSITINPVTSSVDVQVAFQAGQANTAGQYMTLQAGQPFTLENADGSLIDPLTLSLYAGSAVVVEFVIVYP